MKIEYQLLIDLIRRAISNSVDQPAAELNGEQLASLAPALRLAKEHDVLPIVAAALEGCSFPEEYKPLIDKLEKYKLAAIFRTTAMLAEQRDCATALEEAGISFVLLKGAVIRSCYPEPWMRTSSDIDLLIHPEDLDAAMAILQQKLEYSFVCRSAHDVSLESPSGVHLELHFTLIESLRAKESTDVLEQVWSFATPKSEGCAEHRLSTGMYY